MLHLIYYYITEGIQKNDTTFYDFLVEQYNEYFMSFLIASVLSLSFSTLTLIIVIKHVRGVAKVNRVYYNMREYFKK